jgi:hypothetical protein
MGTLKNVAEEAGSGFFELTEELPYAGTYVHGLETLYHSTASIADNIMGDGVDADEHQAKASIHALEAIPMFGMLAGAGHSILDATYGNDAVERAATKRFVEDAGEDRTPAWEEKQKEWEAEDHPAAGEGGARSSAEGVGGDHPPRVKRLPPMPTLPEEPVLDEYGNPQCVGPSVPPEEPVLDEYGNPQCVDRAAP